MLTKTKKIPKKSKTSGHMAQGKPHLKFEEIHEITSQIIDASDGRRTTDNSPIL